MTTFNINNKNLFITIEITVDDDTNKFKVEKIQGKDGIDVLVSATGVVSSYISIQSLGENKYLVGTNGKGFWLLGLIIKIF